MSNSLRDKLAKNSNIILSAIAAVLIVLLIAWIAVEILSGQVAIEENAGIVISEVVSDNSNTLKDGDNEYHDWIELYNASNAPVSMEGYYLSDSIIAPYTWEFPPITLQPGEYIIVFASGKDTFDTTVGEYHTNFKISSEGEDVVLTCIDTQLCRSITMGASQADISYGRVVNTDGSEQYMWFATPSPGKPNIGDCAETIHDLPPALSGIVINEYMNDNTGIVYDADGDYSDWVELHNTTDNDITLTACFLSDTTDNLEKWAFPDGVTVPANGYIVVYLSGKDKYANGELHADFKLSNTDTQLILCDSATRFIDRIDLVDLGENISAGYAPEGEWVFFTRPTPGAANNDVFFSKLSEVKPLEGKVLISEVCGAQLESGTGLPQTDWIEMYNSSDSAVNLQGYTLTNDPEIPSMYTFGNVSIGAGGYLVLDAIGDGAASGQVPFNIDCNGEDIYFFDPSGNMIDSFSSGKLRIGVTSGRSGDGSATRLFFEQPTKGKANSAGFPSYAAEPKIITESGYISAGTSVEISIPEGCTVRYTTDSSEPTVSSPEYTAPLEISSTTVVKARAFAEGKIPSDYVFSTFLIEEEHTVPVICVSSEANGLFSEETGIFNNTRKDNWRPYFTSNFWMDWERRMDVEYFVDGKLQVTFRAGAKVTGYYSRMYEKKSFALHVRGVYGASSVVYPFFGEDSPSTAKALVLRSGAQDQSEAMMRDEYCAQILRTNSETVISADYQPVALYINGQYWGLYFLREKINEDYFALNYGYDKNNIDIIYNRKEAIAGSMDGYVALRDYMRESDMNSPEVWEYVTSQINIESALDYCIFEAFFDNYDAKNIRIVKTPDTKWQWVFFDLDAAMQNSSKSNIGHKYLSNADPLIRELLKNRTFEQMYLERYAELLNTAFTPDNLTSELQTLKAQIEGEIARNGQRWGDLSFNSWTYNVGSLENNLKRRKAIVLSWLKKEHKLSDDEYNRLFISQQ